MILRIITASVQSPLVALANATEFEAGTNSKTQKSYDLARRKAVGWNALLARHLDLGVIRDSICSLKVLRISKKVRQCTESAGYYTLVHFRTSRFITME
jgi:hypothetical protein